MLLYLEHCSGLYEQINAEQLGIVCGSLSPGMVDTEGVRDHVDKARACALPHVKYFDEAFSKNYLTPMRQLMEFVDHLMGLDAHKFAEREWKYSEWARSRHPTTSVFAPQSTTELKRAVNDCL